MKKFGTSAVALLASLGLGTAGVAFAQTEPQTPPGQNESACVEIVGRDLAGSPRAQGNAAPGTNDDAGQDGAVNGNGNGAQDLAAELAGQGSQFADLQTRLTALLRERVFLTGMGIETAFDKGFKSTAATAAEGPINENTQQLGTLIGKFYGNDAEAQFEQLLRQRHRALVNFAQGQATDRQQLNEESQQQLDEVTNRVANFLAETIPGISQQQATQIADVATLRNALSALAQQNGEALRLLNRAADERLAEGKALATAIFNDIRSQLEDCPNPAGPEARANAGANRDAGTTDDTTDDTTDTTTDDTTNNTADEQ